MNEKRPRITTDRPQISPEDKAILERIFPSRMTLTAKVSLAISGFAELLAKSKRKGAKNAAKVRNT